MVHRSLFNSKTCFCFLALLFISACDNNNTSPEKKLNNDVRKIIANEGLTGDPSTGREIPDVNHPVVQLGMKLFFTKSLGGDMDAACVTCHHPVLGGGDDLSLPVGVDAEFPDLLGKGRFHSSVGENFDGGPTVPRNAPTTFNVALWDKVLFHDGRVESLGGTPGKNGDDGMGIRTPEASLGTADSNSGANLAAAQARFPVTSAEEMKNFGLFSGTTNAEVRAYLQQRVGGYGTPPGVLATNSWLEEFRTAFEMPSATAEEVVTFDNMTKAIAEYERSQVFIDNPWKAFVDGNDDAITDSAKRGALLFFNSVANGGANCVACHSGDFFTDEEFHNIGMPQIGRGKGNGDKGNHDFGRFRETANAADMYAFRTPSLLNVTATGPWGHAGAYTSLEAVVRHHFNPQTALDNYDWYQIAPNIQAQDMVTNTQLAIDKLSDEIQAGTSKLTLLSLSDADVDDLLAFLEALTDPCVEDRVCLGKWIPDASDTNPDGLRINAVDENGDFL